MKILKDIYIIKCKDPNLKGCYVGQTAHYIKRCKQHRYNSKCILSDAYHRTIYQYIRNHGGFQNFTIEILHTLEEEQHIINKLEGFYIQKFKALNYQVAGRTRHQYHIDNKETLNAKSILYYNEHRDVLLEKKKEIFLCYCGSLYTRTHKARHIQTNKHQKFMYQV